MSEAHAVLRAEDLEVGYGLTPVVRGVQVRSNAGQLTAIVGPNGAGKSTLIKGLVGILSPSAGRVWLEGDDITGQPPEQLIRRGIAYVPQTANTFPSLTVLENLELGGYVKRSQVRRRVDDVCAMFPDLRPALKRQAKTLSGGQRMMLALARGLIIEPSVLLLDEPTAGLAPLVVDTVWSHILQIRDSGVAVLVVEQNTRRSLADADWAYVLTAGENNLEGPGPELLANEDLVRLYIGGTAGQTTPDG
ncbi:MAG: ABC transporter ATP-binding protein [Nocardiopsaceae bacterium]|jgi:branched-chain amino acid transport system ATP-binding protein|nr:ABC transporter ATP-binding protein [Nocardiopsaceae bacterium]